ncbi:MAG: 2Fe-2S iron-sulfur cluster binding domain-containing protein [Deltaproteobacteria bacterium]|nr:2Fe-2S iron-sulfur cluster binding domain-containing protein [Deltaproteobacteria bacterium]
MSVRVSFLKSGKTVTWDDRLESIVALAWENDILIETDCEQGFCGICKCRLVSGEVDMEAQDGLDDNDLEDNMILPCVSVPKTDIVIDT